MKKDEVRKEFDKLNKEIELYFEDEIENLIEQMKVATPVKTGNLRDSYQDPVKKGKFRWTIVNSAEYASEILLIGKTSYNRGSAQLPDGILPVIVNWKNNLK